MTCQICVSSSSLDDKTWYSSDMSLQRVSFRVCVSWRLAAQSLPSWQHWQNEGRHQIQSMRQSSLQSQLVSAPPFGSICRPASARTASLANVNVIHEDHLTHSFGDDLCSARSWYYSTVHQLEAVVPPLLHVLAHRLPPYTFLQYLQGSYSPPMSRHGLMVLATQQ